MKLYALCFSLLYTAQWTLFPAHAADMGRIEARSQPSPSPLSIPPSQNWDGDDGPWSSFTLQIGTPAQDVRVLISPATDDTLVVSAQGCTGSSDSNCKDDRGGLFNPNSSTSWEQHGYYELNVEPTLGGTGSQAVYGNETVTLGIQGAGGPTLQNQIVAAYADTGLYLGMLGLNPASTNFTATDMNRASYLTTLKTTNMIPSLSFGYTAGNQYRLKQVYGSLTLGGYDASLFTANNVSIPITAAPSRQLLAGLQGLNSKNQNGTGANLMKLVSGGITVSIDPTVGMMWLPSEICSQFESAFGLVKDPQSQLYLVSNDLHTQLVAQNASVTFTLGALATGGQTVDIVLPYASFDLLLKPPAAVGLTQSSKYFPLRQATNESQYTLGRVFFQEIYLTVDYERQNFSISQCIFAENSQQNLIAITSTTSSSSGSSSNTVGIAVGVTVGIVALLALGIAAFFLIRRRRRRQQQQPGSKPTGKKNREDLSEKIRGGYAKGELDTGNENQRYELTGSEAQYHQQLEAGAGKPPSDDGLHDMSPGWVNEKANYPGDRAGMVEADAGGDRGGSGSGSAAGAGVMRAELGSGGGPMGSRSTVRPLHEMHDPSSSQPRFELPAAAAEDQAAEAEGQARSDSLGELQGSTPGSSMPASPVSSMRRSAAAGGVGAGGLRSSPLSAPSSSSPSSGSPHPGASGLDGRLGQQPPTTSANPSRSSFLKFARRSGGNRSSAAAASGPASAVVGGGGGGAGAHASQPSYGRGSAPMTPSPRSGDTTGTTTTPANRRHENNNTSDAATTTTTAAPSSSNPASRRGTFERSGTPFSPYAGEAGNPPTPGVGSPISPQSPDHQQQQQQQHGGLWGRLRRS